MDVREMKRLLQWAACGVALMLSAETSVAGLLCPDQPSRPHVSAAGAENWGYHQTCWQRFPPVPPCDSAAGCQTEMYGFSGAPRQPGGMHAPYSGLQIPHRDLSSPPVSVLPRSLEGQRYSPAPGTSLPSPDIRTFQAAPLSLPPLPSPQPAATGVPGQTSVLPNQLIFGADGRLAIAPINTDAAAVRRSTAFSRYGRLAAPTPFVASQVQPSIPLASLPSAAGIPMQFADSVNTFSASSPAGGSRYGAASLSQWPVQSSLQGQPSARQVGANLEPLLSTPAIHYQR